MKARYYVLVWLIAWVVMAVLLLGRLVGPYNLERERAAARSAGIPLSEAELAQPAPPAAEDAMPVYNRLAALLKAKPFDNGLMARPPAAPREQTILLRELITSRQDVARLVHTAVARPHAYCRIEWSPGEMLPCLSTMRDAALWIHWESELLARDGKYVDAVRNEGQVLRIANQASDEPVYIAHRASLAIESVAMQGFRDIMIEAGNKPGVPEAVFAEVSAYRSNRDLAKCLKGEMVFGVKTLHRVSSLHDLNNLSPAAWDGGQSWEPSPHPASWFTKKFILAPSEAVYVHWMTKYVGAARAPLPERNAAMAGVQKDFDAAPTERTTYRFAAMFVPQYVRAARRDVDSAARRLVVSTSAAVLVYKSRHGTYPATLHEAISPAPLDPLGRPLAYECRGGGKGFILVARTNPTRFGTTSTQGSWLGRGMRAGLRFEYPPSEPSAGEAPYSGGMYMPGAGAFPFAPFRR